MGKNGVKEISNERRFVVSGRVKGDERHATHLKIGVFQRRQEFSDTSPQQSVNFLGLLEKWEIKTESFERSSNMLQNSSIKLPVLAQTDEAKTFDVIYAHRYP